MGITIHYEGKVKEKKNISTIIEFLIEVSKTKKWEYWLTKYDNYIKWSANIDNGCETFSLGFDEKTGELRNIEKTEDGEIWWDHKSFFCKTQYSKDFEGTHKTICGILKSLERFMSDYRVHDEASYYDNPKKDLKEELDRWNDMINGFGKQLRDKFGAENIITGKELSNK